MTKSECAELLGGLGLDLAPRQLDAVVRRTEGWAAALYLAGLAIGDAPDQTRALSRFAGDDRVVVDYIREEFLESVSNRRLTFLRRASVLDRLSGPLCDAVLQQKGSASILRGLSRENMLLIPLDRRDEWFRFHPLLQRMLQAELRDAEPEVEGRLHLRASAWWREQAEWDRAIHHAIEGDATDVAGELLWSIIPEYMTRGRNASITGWLAVLGEERVGDSAAACLTAAWSALTLGNGPQGEHWAARAKTLMEDGATPGDVQSLKAGLLLVDAVMMKGGIKDMRSACSAALELLADDDPWVTICWMLDGIGMHLLGHRDHARKSLLEGIRHGMVVAPNLAVVCMSQLALLAIEEEDWRLADREVSQAHSLVESCGLREYPMVALGFAASAWVRAKSGRVDEASADLAAGRKLLSELESFAPWFEVETRIALAHAAIRLGNRQVARELLADAGTEISHMEDATVLVRWLDEAKAEIGNSEVELDEELTRAELRVLRQLRTHLSLPKIANELHVSPNTVKAQVRSIYSKLGVGSRQAAIERASQAGLLDLDG